MTKLQRRISTAIATSALLLHTFTSIALADTTLEISGNGSNSDSDIKLNTSQTTTVVQNNEAYVSNKVDADANTGGNKANDNTGGDVTIDTGNADTTVKVSNDLNSNSANVACCDAQDTDVLISGNGTNSDNEVKLHQNNDTSVFQTNQAAVYNDVDADANTGKNKANDNTGGDVTINTGAADTHVKVSTLANANWANIGDDGGSSRTLSARIIGNGSNSDNDIKLKLDKSLTLVQDNAAYVYNEVDADANTGKNKANDNTGGDVSIDTGEASAHAQVDNWVNFNWADLDCGCLFDLVAKIAGNGTYSDNDIKAKLNDDRSVFQDNASKLDNDVDADAKTGKNDAKDNTGPAGHDPVEVLTGDADSHVKVENSSNVNTVGGNPLELPWDSFDFNVNFSFNLSDLWALLGLLT